MREAEGVRLVGHTDLDGHGDGMHVNVQDGLAYVGHMGDSGVGTSVVDVTDPSTPTVVTQVPAPDGLRSHKVQVVDALMVVNYERLDGSAANGGLGIFDLDDPRAPREIGRFTVDGPGVHRVTYWEAPYAYVSVRERGYTDRFMMVVDLSVPDRPTEVGRWWLPGMHEAGGEVPGWDPTRRTFNHHHAIVRGDRAYASWWDAGFVILDISDPADPQPITWFDFGEGVGHATHSVVPVPGRDLLVVVEESVRDRGKEPRKHARLVDISDEHHPVHLSDFPVPEGDFVDRGGRFGPHNLHEMRPGSFSSSDIVFLTYFNAGLRVVDISDPRHPTEVGFYIPEAPPGQESIQLNDVFVGADGLVYVTDRFNGGLYVLERT